ncbi:hypothetical protein [Kribbella sancticallisti]|uniref:hypothetical protein n=1 Tax=Kribbella sancticallisti TaxID=460087 RepID=UPI0031D4EEE1
MGGVLLGSGFAATPGRRELGADDRADTGAGDGDIEGTVTSTRTFQDPQNWIPGGRQ